MGPREPGNRPEKRSDLRKGVSPSEATDKNTEKMQVSSHTYKGIPLPNDISDLIRSQKIKLVLFYLYSFAQGIHYTRGVHFERPNSLSEFPPKNVLCLFPYARLPS